MPLKALIARNLSPKQWQAFADEDRALPIGHEQTISQPSLVASMTERLLCQTRLNRVLEIGTGSGYQAAILSYCVNEVDTIERIRPLYERALPLFQQPIYDNVHLHFGDGLLGWKSKAPFDGIIITAATETIPPALLEQLAPKGRLIVPLGTPGVGQTLCVIDKTHHHGQPQWFESVVFVPLLPGESD